MRVCVCVCVYVRVRQCVHQRESYTSGRPGAWKPCSVLVNVLHSRAGGLKTSCRGVEVPNPAILATRLKKNNGTTVEFISV